MGCKKQVEIIKKELKWEDDLNAGIPPEYSYEKIECQVQGKRLHKIFKKRLWKNSHLVALDLRNKRISIDEAKKLIQKYDGKKPHSLNKFLEILNISEDEFTK